MSSSAAIEVVDLAKCYHIYDKPRDRLFQMLARGRRQFYKEHWALRPISFSIKRGETVGIVGRNGSGKSTLLQLICGTLNPTMGQIRTNGRIAALLELGSGFNPEFTGRENVYMNATILGLTTDEIDERFDSIASFADIGEFLEQPVKTYSSGMFVRLAFAVNIMSQPDIMIVDEALAVGDMAFQSKCITALKKLQETGTTVLFVSHDIGSIKSLCDSAIFLDRGYLISQGDAASIAEKYVRMMREEMNASSTTLVDVEHKNGVLEANAAAGFKKSEEFDKNAALFRYGKGGAKISFVELLDEFGSPLTHCEFNQEATVKIYFQAEQNLTLSVNYYIQDDKKNLILGSGFRLAGVNLIECEPNDHYVVSYKTRLPLQDGNYSIQVQLTQPIIQDRQAEFIDVIDDAVVFNMQPRASGRVWTKVFIKNMCEVKKYEL